MAKVIKHKSVENERFTIMYLREVKEICERNEGFPTALDQKVSFPILLTCYFYWLRWYGTEAVKLFPSQLEVEYGIAPKTARRAWKRLEEIGVIHNGFFSTNIADEDEDVKMLYVHEILLKSGDYIDYYSDRETAVASYKELTRTVAESMIRLKDDELRKRNEWMKQNTDFYEE